MITPASQIPLYSQIHHMAVLLWIKLGSLWVTFVVVFKWCRFQYQYLNQRTMDGAHCPEISIIFSSLWETRLSVLNIYSWEKSWNVTHVTYGTRRPSSPAAKHLVTLYTVQMSANLLAHACRRSFHRGTLRGLLGSLSSPPGKSSSQLSWDIWRSLDHQAAEWASGEICYGFTV